MVFICSHHHLELPTGILSCSVHHAKSVSPDTCHSIVLPVYLRWHLGHLRRLIHLQIVQSRSAAVGRWEKDLPNKTGCHPENSPWNLKATWTKAHLKVSPICKKWIKPQITQTYMIWNENPSTPEIRNWSVFWSVLCQALLFPNYWENGSHMFSSSPGTTYRHSKLFFPPC